MNGTVCYPVIKLINTKYINLYVNITVYFLKSSSGKLMMKMI
jgi:hypothetical protein